MHSNANLFCCYNIILSLLTKCGLIIEYRKTNIFHFSKSHSLFNPSPLDLSSLGGLVLLPKDIWKYLGFIFNCKLNFRNHIDFYVNKVISTIKYMKLLDNLSRGINLLQKRKLYRSCTLPITLYSFPLWYYNKVLTHYYLNMLSKIQWRAALWISEAFCTSLIPRIKAISGLVLIYLHLRKLYSQFLLRESSLPSNHIISNILSSNKMQERSCHISFIDYFTAKQRIQLKSLLINVDNKCNEVFPSFSFFNKEFEPGNRLIDLFSDYFSFHFCSPNLKKHIEKLDEIAFRALSNSLLTIVVSDTSIKNHVITSILHIHSYNKPIVKTLHRAINITTIEAKLFAICCGINQVVTNQDVNHIVVITDSLHTAKKIFDSSVYPYQTYSAAISQELRKFFSRDSRNYIEFWDCPSKQKWPLHYLVNKDIKSMVFTPLFPCKSFWDFYRKTEYNTILSQ